MWLTVAVWAREPETNASWRFMSSGHQQLCVNPELNNVHTQLLSETHRRLKLFDIEPSVNVLYFNMFIQLCCCCVYLSRTGKYFNSSVASLGLIRILVVSATCLLFLWLCMTFIAFMFETHKIHALSFNVPKHRHTECVCGCVCVTILTCSLWDHISSQLPSKHFS